MNLRFFVTVALCCAFTGCQKAALAPTNAAPGNSAAPSASAPSSPALPISATPEEDTQQDADEQRMLVLINSHRADNGLAPLKTQLLLIHSSRWLSQDMASRSYLSHTDSLGRDSFQRMDAFGFELNGWRGENIACGNGDAEKTYLQWLYSPGHNANMLGEHYTLIGIARAYDSSSAYGWYWTTDFGSD